MNNTTSRADILYAIKSGNLSGSIVCLHSSLKSFGYLEGGADTVIQAFLATGCTLLVPTFTYDCEVPPPPDRTLLQNGDEGYQPISHEEALAFQPDSAMISQGMGKIPARIIELKESIRSGHPLNSFAAIGPDAKEIIEAQNFLNVYGPYKKVYTLPRRAYLILIGVGLTSTTPVHFAEEVSGRRQFRQWARYADDSVVEVEVGSCSDGFNNLDPVVKNIETRLKVGESQWRIYPLQEFIDTLAGAIRQNPLLTHCANPDCARCNDAARGGLLL